MAAVVEIVIAESTCEASERPMAWIVGFAIFIAVDVCCTVAEGVIILIK